MKENELYDQTDEHFSLNFNYEDEQTISKIASSLYTSGNIQKKLRTLAEFFEKHETSIQQDFLEISSDLKKVILKHSYNEHSLDKNNINRYDRAVTEFKHSIINTIQLKLGQCEDYTGVIQNNCTLEFNRNSSISHSPSRVENLVIADAVATAITIDPALHVESHKMHSHVHLALKIGSLIHEFLKNHLTLNQFMARILQVINDELVLIHMNKEQTKLLFELIADYLQGLRNESKFKFERCNRYSGDSGNGVRIIADQSLHRGEEISGLSGRVVKILQQDRGRDHFSYDFSIMLNGRKREMIYLGPGSFLNHDCDPNVEYTARENKKVAINTLKDIDEGEEINVFYRDNYFGDDNKDCECRICEREGCGAFARESITEDFMKYSTI
ncbi:hypothetical protein QAD02_000765 [Eretmocerus hayati]|uniref:Uncharacterized protein n=1 Tax=Eretmocerus hayati TaxID=131215 RepID=A0ACC2NFR6_9HYME|nr:hypothetical protein QAD02_000765 [Eretmocerus hayati]